MTSRTEGFVRRASFAVSATCIVALLGTSAVVFWPRVTHALGIKPKPAPMPYLPGGQIDTPADWQADSPYTLVIFARASCGACDKALPYFKQLVEFVSARTAIVVAGGGDARDQDAAFARRMGAKEADFKVAPAGLRVRATPTLVLVDRQGHILAAWEGVGPPEKQNAIARMLDDILK